MSTLFSFVHSFIYFIFLFYAFFWSGQRTFVFPPQVIRNTITSVPSTSTLDQETVNGLQYRSPTGEWWATSVKSKELFIFLLSFSQLTHTRLPTSLLKLLLPPGTTSTSWWARGGLTWRTCTRPTCPSTASSSARATWCGSTLAQCTGCRLLAGAITSPGTWDLLLVWSHRKHVLS